MCADGNAVGAARLLGEFWREEHNSSRAGFVVSCYERLRPQLALRPVRIALLRSFTVEPLMPMLRAEAFTVGLDFNVHIGEFNAYAQEILDPDSQLYRFQPDVVILCVQTRDIAPELWSRFTALDPEQSQAAANRVIESFGNWIRIFRERSNANLVIHNLETPDFPLAGILDSQSGHSQAEVIRGVNAAIADKARKEHGVYILDYDGLISRKGHEQWHDESKWLTARLPIQSRHLYEMVREWFRYIHPITGRVSKAAVFDLDNTIWGGVIGEEGLQGIHLGNEYPGASFQDVQRALLDLHRRGILLVICSKNNLDDVWPVFDQHPGMLIGRNHLAAWRINWKPKAENLREIAAELNIGIDALAFIDDNPIERQHIRTELPEVAVLELPAQPALYARHIRQFPWFERLSISQEDRQRGEMYAVQRQRAELEQSSGSREDFYRSLQQVVEISPVNTTSLARVAQLTQKTNQFNLTTKRYSEQEIKEISSRNGWSVYSLRVTDRFADNGLVGVAIVCESADALMIDTLLLSCRVISRTVETALLSYLVEQARACGLTKVRGWFYPTRKNAPSQDFYKAHGFTAVSSDANGVLWELELSGRATVQCPEWIRLTAPAQAPIA